MNNFLQQTHKTTLKLLRESTNKVKEHNSKVHILFRLFWPTQKAFNTAKYYDINSITEGKNKKHKITSKERKRTKISSLLKQGKRKHGKGTNRIYKWYVICILANQNDRPDDKAV